ncbi:hypothetical protein [Dysgonomonas sp.]
MRNLFIPGDTSPGTWMRIRCLVLFAQDRSSPFAYTSSPGPVKSPLPSQSTHTRTSNTVQLSHCIYLQAAIVSLHPVCAENTEFFLS